MPQLGLIGGRGRFRQQYRQRFVSAPDPRSYLVAVADMLAHLSDPHVQISNVGDFMRRNGVPLMTNPIPNACEIGGQTWIKVIPQYVVETKPLRDQPTLVRDPAREVHTTPFGDDDGEQWFELVSVDGVPASSVALSLLSGAPQSQINVVVLDQDDELLSLMLQCPVPLPARTPPPGAMLPTAPPLPDVMPLPFRDFDGVGYITLNNLDSEQTVRSFDLSLDMLMTSKVQALVLDLRSNRGGIMKPVIDILGRFVVRPRPFATITTRGVIPVGWRAPVWDRAVLSAVPRGRPFVKPLVVLIGSETASAGEVLAAALKDVRNAELIGERTVGAGAGTGDFEVLDGLTVTMSYWPLERLDGRTIQYHGVVPDVALAFPRREFQRDGIVALRRWNQQVTDTAIARARVAASTHALPPAPAGDTVSHVHP